MKSTPLGRIPDNSYNPIPSLTPHRFLELSLCHTRYTQTFKIYILIVRRTSKIFQPVVVRFGHRVDGWRMANSNGEYKHVHLRNRASIYSHGERGVDQDERDNRVEGRRFDFRPRQVYHNDVVCVCKFEYNKVVSLWPAVLSIQVQNKSYCIKIRTQNAIGTRKLNTSLYIYEQ